MAVTIDVPVWAQAEFRIQTVKSEFMIPDPAVSEWATMPVIRERELCKGIYVGNCIAAWDNPFPRTHHIAHAHVDPNDEFVGWICLKELFGLHDMRLLRHEYAHLCTPNDLLHGRTWRECLRAMGEVDEANRYDLSFVRAKRLASVKVEINGIAKGDMVRIRSGARPAKYVGETAIVQSITPSRAVIEFTDINSRMNYWPVNLLELYKKAGA